MSIKPLYFCVIVAAVCLLAGPTAPAQNDAPESFEARIVSARSATIFRINTGENERTLFLFGVTSPPKDTSDATRARARAELMALGQSVRVVVRDDSTPILYGDVLLPGGKNLAHELLRSGWARWDETRAPEDEALAALQDRAKAEGAGIWAAHVSTSREETETDPESKPAWERDEPIVIGSDVSRTRYRKRDARTDRLGTIQLQSRGTLSTKVIIERKQQLREQRAAQEADRRAAEEEARIEYEQQMEERAQERMEQEAAYLERQQQLLELERENLRNQLLYENINRYNQPNYYYQFNTSPGGYYYPNTYYYLPGFVPQVTINQRTVVDDDERAGMGR